MIAKDAQLRTLSSIFGGRTQNGSRRPIDHLQKDDVPHSETSRLHVLALTAHTC